MKLREITCEDQDEEVRGCELWVVEFRENEKNKEDQGEEVCGCGLREVLNIFGEIKRNHL